MLFLPRPDWMDADGPVLVRWAHWVIQVVASPGLQDEPPLPVTDLDSSVFFTTFQPNRDAKTLLLAMPVLLYVATFAAWIAINPQFAPTV